MMKEQYSLYDYELKKCIVQTKSGKFDGMKWIYVIHGSPCYPYDDGKIESEEWYDSESEARYAVRNKICLLENGER